MAKLFKKNTIEKKTRVAPDKLDYLVTETAGGEDDGITILLCGVTKSGRSQLASTFPSALFLDLDRGLDTPAVKKSSAKKIVFNRGEETSRLLLQVLFDIQEKQGAFEKWQPQTVVLDSITAMCEHFEEECRIYDPESKDPEKDSRGDGLFRGDYNSIFTRTVRIIDYAKGLVPYFICIANVKLNDDPMLQGKVESPAVSGQQLPAHIPHAFGEVYYMGYDSVKKDFYLTTKKDGRFKYSGTKHKVPARIYNPTFDKLKKYYEE